MVKLLKTFCSKEEFETVDKLTEPIAEISVFGSAGNTVFEVEEYKYR